MTDGLKTIIVPVTDPSTAKGLYGELLGVAPSVDEPYHIGFDVDGQHLGLDPDGLLQP